MERRKERSLWLYSIGRTFADQEVWDNMVASTNKATEGKDRVFDPFVGYIEKEKRS